MEDTVRVKEIEYAPGYFVSPHGRVFSVLPVNVCGKRIVWRIKELLGELRKGYLRVTLYTKARREYKSSKAGRRRSIHTLVMELYGPEPEWAQNLIRHKDHNRQNNEIWNLEWGTDQENRNDRKAREEDETLYEWEEELLGETA